MYRLGVTGSIATGKSTLLSALRDLDVPVFSADQTVAELYGGDAVAAVEALFPGTAIEGVIDRQRLSSALAADPSRFKRLEAVVHPMVRTRIARFLDGAEADGHALAAVEVPLLFESGHDYGFDGVAVTFVDPALQRERAMARPGMTVEKLETILARQMRQDEKKRRASFVFDTSHGIEQTRSEVAQLVARLRNPGQQT